MQKRLLHSFLLLIGLMAFGLLTQSGNAQKKSTPLPADSTKKATYDFIKTSLGCQKDKTGYLPINKEMATALLKSKICATDTKTNTQLAIRGFEMTYCEKGLYEDSTGLPTVITECQLIYFEGDSISTVWEKNFNERLYKGDSISLNNIVVRYDNKSIRLNEKINIAIK
jgi:hypothetical protein